MTIETWLKELAPRVRLMQTKKIFFKKYAYRIYLSTYFDKNHYYSNRNTINYRLEQFCRKHEIEAKTMFSGWYTLILYTTDEKSLRLLLENVFKEDVKYLREVHYVDKPENLELLQSGHILYKGTPEYNYSLTLRSGFYDVVEKQSLANYLQALGDDVRATKSVIKKLSESHYRYFSGSTVKLKDQRVAELIRLISPRIVGTVNILTQAK